jgi:putative colanic acid biosynthesis acetyltransferase WcaF
MSFVSLRGYNKGNYHPGRSRVWQVGWFFVGQPLLSASFIPGSGYRVAILRLFGARMGSGIVIKPSVRVKYPWHLRAGNDVWIGEHCWIDNLTTVRIGNDVCLSQGAYLCTGNHSWSDPNFELSVEPIVLGDGSWVGAKAVLSPGVVLGECAVASLGSIVTNNIPAYEVYGGNPARFVRQRKITARSTTARSLQTLGGQ